MLDHDGFGELGADAEAGVADLADDVGVLHQQADALFFAEAHFAQPSGDLSGAVELFDADRCAGLDRVERAQLGLRTAVGRLAGVGIVGRAHG